MATGKSSSKPEKIGRKCRSCSLDCAVVRMLALQRFPDSEKKNRENMMFGEKKPLYNSSICPKK